MGIGKSIRNETNWIHFRQIDLQSAIFTGLCYVNTKEEMPFYSEITIKYSLCFPGFFLKIRSVLNGHA